MYFQYQEPWFFKFYYIFVCVVVVGSMETFMLLYLFMYMSIVMQDKLHC